MVDGIIGNDSNNEQGGGRTCVEHQRSTPYITLGIVIIATVVMGIEACVHNRNEHNHETGIVRVKKDGVLYVSPLKDTLVDRKIQFTDEPKYREAYDITSVGDTIRFYNPKHDINIAANPVYLDVKINGKDLECFKREFNKNQQLQQIRMEAHQK